MKKTFVLQILLTILLMNNCFASEKIHVEALNDFSSLTPSPILKARVIESEKFYDTILITNDILKCRLEKIKDPTRAKQDAKMFYILESYEDFKGIHPFKEKYIAKYAKTILSENKGQVTKKVATTAGSLYVKGLSYGVSFVEGIKNNKEDNRFVSGVKKMYDDSFLSMVEYGENIEIKTGETFYLIVKKYAQTENNEDISQD